MPNSLIIHEKMRSKGKIVALELRKNRFNAIVPPQEEKEIYLNISNAYSHVKGGLSL